MSPQVWATTLSRFSSNFFSMNTVHWTAFRVCDLRCCRFCNKIEILSSEKDQKNSDATLICPDWHMNNLISGDRVRRKVKESVAIDFHSYLTGEGLLLLASFRRLIPHFLYTDYVVFSLWKIQMIAQCSESEPHVGTCTKDKSTENH